MKRGLVSLVLAVVLFPVAARADYWVDGGLSCRQRGDGEGDDGGMSDAGADAADGSDDATAPVCEAVRWPLGTVTYRIAAEGLAAPYGFPAGLDAAAAHDAIVAAFETWNAVPCIGLQFVEGERQGMPRLDPREMPGFTPHLDVFFSDDMGLWQSVRVGTAQFIEDTELTIETGIIALNSKDHSWSVDGAMGTLDVQSIVTALIGKHLGIDATVGNVTDGIYYPGNRDKRNLGEDDIAAMQYLYGGADCPDVPPPQQVCVDMLDPTNMCPPPPNPDGGFSDAGTRDGGRPDSGGGTDSGTTPDSGMMGDDDDDDDCDCAVAGHDQQEERDTPWGLALFSVALAAIALRRRKR